VLDDIKQSVTGVVFTVDSDEFHIVELLSFFVWLWLRLRLPWYRKSPSIAPCGAEKRGKKRKRQHLHLAIAFADVGVGY
jgi:hypothetical protein